jgi:hypothetical protein
LKQKKTGSPQDTRFATALVLIPALVFHPKILTYFLPFKQIIFPN